MTFFCLITIILIFNAIWLSDGANCTSGWVQHGDSCYHVGFDEKRWSASMSACEDHNSHLINIETAEENAFIVNYLHSLPNGADEYWLGGSDWSAENVWVLEPIGKNISYSNWYPGQPNNRDGQENCMSLYTTPLKYDGMWFDEHCEEKLFYICEKG